MNPPTTAKVVDRYNKVVNRLASFVDGTVQTTEAVSSILSIQADVCLPRGAKQTISQNAAQTESLEHLINAPVSLNKLKANMFRVIANFHFIQDSMAIPDWDGGKDTADIVVIGVRRLKCMPGKRPEFVQRVKLHTGQGAGLAVNTVILEEQVYRFLNKVAGVSKYNCSSEEISGMEARAVVEYDGKHFRIDQWTCTQKQKQHNKEQTERRQDVRKCRRGIPCNVCKCTIMQCPQAVWLPLEVKNGERA